MKIIACTLSLVLVITVMVGFAGCGDSIQETVQAYIEQANQLAEDGRDDEAIAACNQAIELDPDAAELYIIRSQAYNKTGQYDQAIADANKAIQLDLNSTMPYSNRGKALYLQKQYNLALADLEKAISLDQDNAEAYYIRGLIYQDLAQKNEAVANFERCITTAQDPRQVELARQQLDIINTAPDKPSSSPTPEGELNVPALDGENEPDTQIETEETAEFDIVWDGLKIQYLADGYRVELIRQTAFGLPGQLSMLPNGDIVITDGNVPRIQILSEGEIRTIVQDNNIMRRSATAMPDGRVCYGMQGGEIFITDPDTGVTEMLGKLDSYHGPKAFAADSDNNVYVVTTQGYLYRFSPEGERTIISDSLPFADVEFQISDIAVADDGTSYVSGWHYFVSVSPEGEIKVITDDLHSEPTFCDIDPEGNVYIKDLFAGVRHFNPVTGTLTPLGTESVAGKDILAVSSKEFIFVETGVDAFCSYNLETHTYTPLFINTINSWAFAADNNDSVFLSTPYVEDAFSPYMVHLSRNGNREDLPGLSFDYISGADVDEENRICIFADSSIHRLEPDGKVTSIFPNFPYRSLGEGSVDIAAGPGETWYGITTNHNDSIKVWRTDATGKVTLLPISFNKDSFGGVYRVGTARIDFSKDGQLLIFVNAPVTNGRGPLCQRVYRADADGYNLTEVAALDSGRIGGMVDIAAGPEGDIFVKSPHEGYDGIHHIDRNNNLSEILLFHPGRDLKSIDVDPKGNVWFCSTLGIFRVSRQP
jgi:Tfp pilus assembly protein PilF